MLSLCQTVLLANDIMVLDRDVKNDVHGRDPVLILGQGKFSSFMP